MLPTAHRDREVTATHPQSLIRKNSPAQMSTVPKLRNLTQILGFQMLVTVSRLVTLSPERKLVKYLVLTL